MTWYDLVWFPIVFNGLLTLSMVDHSFHDVRRADFIFIKQCCDHDQCTLSPFDCWLSILRFVVKAQGKHRPVCFAWFYNQIGQVVDILNEIMHIQSSPISVIGPWSDKEPPGLARGGTYDIRTCLGRPWVGDSQTDRAFSKTGVRKQLENYYTIARTQLGHNSIVQQIDEGPVHC